MDSIPKYFFPLVPVLMLLGLSNKAFLLPSQRTLTISLLKGLDHIALYICILKTQPIAVVSTKLQS